MRDLFLKDWGWKLFSLLLAVAIWFTVNHILHESGAPAGPVAGSQVTYESLPLSVVSATSDVHLYRIAPNTVSVTISGPPKNIAVLQANQISAIVDLTHFDPATDTKQNVEVSVPNGITLVRVDPDKVNVIIPPAPEKKP